MVQPLTTNVLLKSATGTEETTLSGLFIAFAESDIKEVIAIGGDVTTVSVGDMVYSDEGRPVSHQGVAYELVKEDSILAKVTE